MDPNAARTGISRYLPSWRIPAGMRLPSLLDAPLELLLPTRNPVFMRSLRSKMRSGRSYLFLVIYVLTLLLVISLIALGNMVDQRVRMGSAEAEQAGQIMFFAMVIAQACLITLFTPISTCSFIASETEKQTYEMLSLTILRDSTLLCGELLGSFCFIFLLTFATLPLAGVCLMIGGVSLLDMLLAEGILLLLSIFWSTFGLCIAVTVRKRIPALLLTLLILTAANLLLIPAIAEDEPRFALAFNPALAIPAIHMPRFNLDYFNVNMPVWPLVIVLSLAASAVFVLWSVRLMRDPKRAPLNLLQGILVYGLVMVHLAGGLWHVSLIKEVLLAYTLILLIGAFLTIALTAESRESRLRMGSFFTRGESPLGFILPAALSAALFHEFTSNAMIPRPAGQFLNPVTASHVMVTLSSAIFAFWAVSRLFKTLTRERWDPRALLIILASVWCIAAPVLVAGRLPMRYSDGLLAVLALTVKATPCWELMDHAGLSLVPRAVNALSQGPPSYILAPLFHCIIGVLAWAAAGWKGRKPSETPTPVFDL